MVFFKQVGENSMYIYGQKIQLAIISRWAPIRLPSVTWSWIFFLIYAFNYFESSEFLSTFDLRIQIIIIILFSSRWSHFYIVIRHHLPFLYKWQVGKIFSWSLKGKLIGHQWENEVILPVVVSREPAWELSLLKSSFWV